STKDHAKGKMHQIKGKINEAVGKTVGNSDLESKGKKEHLEGKVQEKISDIEKSLDQ
ncbi:MAG: CsbD family protein, partial [Desulfamplus sp.]|nr:CsbD family protein [Desulfamplus sp.]